MTDPDNWFGDSEAALGTQISEKTVERMRWYLNILDSLSDDGVSVVASREIAEKVGINSGLVRKDLSHFGGFGRPSVGYNVAYLQKKIRDILSVNRTQNIAWIGIRRINDDPSLMEQLAKNKYRIAAVFDASPASDTFVDGIPIFPLDDLNSEIISREIEIAVMAVSGEDAQKTADILVAGGIRAILNLAPIHIEVPKEITVRNMDITGELILLSYYSAKTNHKSSKR